MHNDLPVVPNAHSWQVPYLFPSTAYWQNELVRYFFRSGTTLIFVQLDTVDRIFATGQFSLKLDVKKSVCFAIGTGPIFPRQVLVLKTLSLLQPFVSHDRQVTPYH